MSLAALRPRNGRRWDQDGLLGQTVRRSVSGSIAGVAKKGINAFGIDLGTTNSCIAVYEDGIPRVLANEEGSRTTPSIISFDKKKDGTVEEIVGSLGKQRLLTNPKETIFATKRLIGRSYDDRQTQKCRQMVPYEIVRAENGDAWISVAGKKLSPGEISAKVLGKMRMIGESYLGQAAPRKIPAVVTVPAYFNDAQRQATKSAGQIAGLDVVRIINEPTAAALAYGIEQKTGKTIVVYDLGGGTFDVSILEISGSGLFEVRATRGDTFLGGEDFDREIVKYFLSEFRKENGIDLSKDRGAMQRLKEAAERAKVELSARSETVVSVPFLSIDKSGPKSLSLTLTRAKINSLVQGLVERTIEPCRRALKDAGMVSRDVDDVIMVGGQTRMPMVLDSVSSFFGKKPYTGMNPDEVVAIGAAIQGSVVSGGVSDVLLLDVTSLSLGIETLGGVFTKLINRNTTIPVKAEQVFSTAFDNQTKVKIKVLQGERDMATDNKMLGEFELVDIPPAPRGVPQIAVSFNIDANGIVSVSAKDRATGKEQKITVQASSGLSEEEVSRLVEEAEIHREEDKAKRKTVELRADAEAKVNDARRVIEVHKAKLPIAAVNEVEKAINAAVESMKQDSAQALESGVKELETKLMKLYGKIDRK